MVLIKQAERLQLSISLRFFHAGILVTYVLAELLGMFMFRRTALPIRDMSKQTRGAVAIKHPAPILACRYCGNLCACGIARHVHVSAHSHAHPRYAQTSKRSGCAQASRSALACQSCDGGCACAATGHVHVDDWRDCSSVYHHAIDTLMFRRTALPIRDMPK